MVGGGVRRDGGFGGFVEMVGLVALSRWLVGGLVGMAGWWPLLRLSHSFPFQPPSVGTHLRTKSSRDHVELIIVASH